MDCSTLGFPVLHYLPKFAQTHVHRVGDGIQPSHIIPFSSCPQSFPTSGSFLMSQFFASDSQIIGISASASVLSMNIQGWIPLGLTGLTSLQSKELQGTVYWLKDVHKEQETNYIARISLVAQWLRLWLLVQGAVVQSLGRGTKIPHASWPKKPKHKKKKEIL